MPTTDSRDSVAVLIDDRAWRGVNDIELHRGIDTHPTIGFASPFDPERREMRETFRPMSFKPLVATIGGEPLFTGKLVEAVPTRDAKSSVVQCSGYSLPAELEDINLPGDRVPFEASGLSLRQIAEALASINGITVLMLVDDGGAFSKVHTRQRSVDTRVDHDTKIDAFLVELAKQRGIVRTSNARGQLVFWQSVRPGNPVARLVEGEPGIVSVVPSFSPQDYYSEITGFTSAKRGRTGSQFTERNRRLSGGVLRPMSFRLDDVEKGDAPNAVRAKMARMFGNAVSYVVNLPSWRGPNGELWEPNTTITLQAPGAMVYGETELLIRDVYLKQSDSEQTASLGCVLPGAFSGEQPDRMPWDEPL